MFAYPRVVLRDKEALAAPLEVRGHTHATGGAAVAGRVRRVHGATPNNQENQNQSNNYLLDRGWRIDTFGGHDPTRTQSPACTQPIPFAIHSRGVQVPMD